ncbi:MAG: hypothetical protein GEU97_05355 [Actinophytocola sp.]|nr:hypothetical protein [Actinophytocola sp.]
MGRQRRGGRTHTPERIEDVFSERVLSDPNVDRDYLNELLHDPSPLRVPEPPTPPGPENVVRDELESATARVAKLTGLVIAVALLCGSLVTAVFLDRHRTTAREAQPPERQITGIAALAGFAMTTPPPVETAPVTERAATIPTDDEATTPAEPDDATTSGPSTTSEPATPVSTADDVDAFVRDFYDRVTAGPDDALPLLGGNLLDAKPDVLIDALRRIDAVAVHRVSVRPDGLVRAVVTVTRANAQRYRVTHLLRVEAGPPALITEARLLSSQHSPAQ